VEITVKSQQLAKSAEDGANEQRMGPEHYGQERQESHAERAERVVAEKLRRRRWREGTWEERRKGDEEKAKIAMRLRKETVVTAAWIAARLPMGSVANVNALLYQQRRTTSRS